MKKIIPALLASAFLMPSYAYADAGPGYVSHALTIFEDHSLLFNQSGSRSGTPACGQGLPVRWAIDPTTPFGQAEMSVILSAYALHKQVTITGTGNCGVHPDTETAKYIDIQD